MKNKMETKMKKTYLIVIIAVAAILIVAGIFLVIHKTSSPTPQQETQISGVSNDAVNSVGQAVDSVNDSDFSDNSLDSLG